MIPRYTLLDGYSISRIVKGGWHLAGDHGSVQPRQAIEDMAAFVEAGITTFDCADIYTGVEQLIGDFRRAYPALGRQVQVHTKFVPDLSDLESVDRRYVENIIDRSLQRLQIERLDLVQFHWWDFGVPRYVETALELDRLRRAGKIANLALTNFYTPHLAEVITAGVPIVAHQLQYSLVDDRPNIRMVEFCGAHGIVLLCYGTVLGGFLSERWLGKPEPRTGLKNRSLIKYKLIIDDFGGWDLFQQLLEVLAAAAAFFAGRLVVGLGEAVLSPAAISLISDYFPPSRRGTAVGCFLSGIAMGIGASILIGGGVLHLVQAGALAGTPLAAQAPWRLVLLLIGAPGLLWAFATLAIREPVRRGTEKPLRAASPVDLSAAPSVRWARVVPIYLVVGIASLVDNAVGAWAPTLLTRDFHMDRAQAGVELGILLTAAFGGGVLAGGWLADRAGLRGGLPGKLLVCLVAGALILPVAASIDAAHLTIVLLSIPAYFALSGIVTACGFSAILDVVPNRSRGLAMSISFFLNVAVGGAVGPTAVALASDHVFGSAAGLGPAIAVTVAVAYGLAVIALLGALSSGRVAGR